MSERAAQLIQEDMQYMGPVRVSDVEQAQQKIVDIVRRLEDAGEIIIAGRGGEKEMVGVTDLVQSIDECRVQNRIRLHSAFCTHHSAINDQFMAVIKSTQPAPVLIAVFYSGYRNAGSDAFIACSAAPRSYCWREAQREGESIKGCRQSRRFCGGAKRRLVEGRGRRP